MEFLPTCLSSRLFALHTGSPTGSTRFLTMAPSHLERNSDPALGLDGILGGTEKRFGSTQSAGRCAIRGSRWSDPKTAGCGVSDAPGYLKVVCLQ